MRFMPAWLHGVDYVIGLLVLASPWLFGFEDSTAVGVHVVGGIAVIATVAVTDFELGLLRVMPMSVHLGIDALVGLLALASPWLFDVSAYAGLHVVLGVVELLAAAMTATRPAGRPVAS